MSSALTEARSLENLPSNFNEFSENYKFIYNMSPRTKDADYGVTYGRHYHFHCNEIVANKIISVSISVYLCYLRENMDPLSQDIQADIKVQCSNEKNDNQEVPDHVIEKVTTAAIENLRSEKKVFIFLNNKEIKV